MAIVSLEGIPSEKEIAWLDKNIGPRRTWLPHYISGVGWKIQKTSVLSYPNPGYNTTWSIEFEDEKLASYYILKFK
jgi:hypothetical protein